MEVSHNSTQYMQVFRLNSHLFHLTVTTCLTLFLKVFNLQGIVASKSAGNWFQFMMVLFTNEYLPMSVLCYLLPELIDPQNNTLFFPSP
jgi:hypothetical protein